MDEKDKVEGYYLNEAIRIVDTMFEGGLFNEKMTREDMRVLDDMLGFYLQSYARSAHRIEAAMLKIKKIQQPK